jgi:hypothetical protein
MNNISIYNNNPNSRRISRSVSKDFSIQKFYNINNKNNNNSQYYNQNPSSVGNFNNAYKAEIESKIKDKVEKDKKLYKIFKQQTSLINKIKADNVSNINQNTQEIFYTEEDLQERQIKENNKSEILDNSYNNPNYNVNVSNLNNYNKIYSEENCRLENSGQISSIFYYF